MTKTPYVGQLAQSKAQLQLDRITVIGLLSTPQSDSALLRMGDGEIQKVAAGDTAGVLTVLAIDDAVVTLRDHRGQTFQLTVPGTT
jgi:Tfp pilus assembly protein PilP